jgi:hypothetical protein
VDREAPRLLESASEPVTFHHVLTCPDNREPDFLFLFDSASNSAEPQRHLATVAILVPLEKALKVGGNLGHLQIATAANFVRD